MKKTVTSSAPGKFHLIGEHSAVYCKPAILCAIDKRVTVQLVVSKKDSFFEGDELAKNAVSAIRKYILKVYKAKNVQVSIKTTSTIPVGRGLGSSAALCASIAAAFFNLYDLKFDLEAIFNAAYEGEKVFHGNPSGGDLAISIYGGAIWFRKETESIKLYKKIEISNSVLKQFLLVDSGKPEENTKEMVVMIMEKLKLKNNNVLSFADSQEALTKSLSEALNKNDEKEILRIIKDAEKNLEDLGVVGKKARNIIKVLSIGKTGAKISGAGGIKEGSGMLLVYSSEKSKVMEYCKSKYLEFLKINLDTEGVKIVEET